MRFHLIDEMLSNKPTQELWFGESRSAPLAQLRSAQKFYFGSVDQFPGDHVEWTEFPRLPYPMAALEIEPPQTGLAKLVSIIAVLVEEDDKIGGTFFSVEPALKRITNFGCYGIDRATGQSAYYPTSQIARGPRENWKVLADTCASSMAAMGLALRVLNCSNVTTETIYTPDKLNKKRVRLGRPPIYEYKVLRLKSNKSGLLNGGTHSTPRIHLRRGHIKHRKTGDFWWQPHVVGDRQKGMVVKDYDASRLA